MLVKILHTWLEYIFNVLNYKYVCVTHICILIMLEQFNTDYAWNT